MELIASLVQLGHLESREHEAVIELPFLLLLQQYRTHQAGDRGVDGEDADDEGTSFDLLVKPLQRVGAPDLAPVLRWVGRFGKPGRLPLPVLSVSQRLGISRLAL